MEHRNAREKYGAPILSDGIGLLDQDAAAKALNVSPLTLKAARLGRLKPGHPLLLLPHVRLGKKPLYRAADIEALVRDNLVVPADADHGVAA